MPPLVHKPGHPAKLVRTRSGPWSLAHAYRNSNPGAVKRAIAGDLAGGLQLVWLCRASADAPHGRGGVRWSSLAELDTILHHVDLASTKVVLEAGAAGCETAAMLAALAQSRGLDLRTLQGAIFADPLAELACTGQLGRSLEQTFVELLHLASWSHAHTPNMRSIGVSASPYHEAGASAVQEVAYALATGIEILRRGVAAGQPVEQLAGQFVFQLALGRNLLTTCAKLRALRLLWGRVVARAGGSQTAQEMYLHASGSWRELACAEPWTNLLRGTVQGVAATMGEVDSLDLPGFDSGDRPDSEFARHLARNTQLLLRDEANLGRVRDPAGQSGYIEQLTTQIARAAWDVVRTVEENGGMSTALMRGEIQQTCVAALAEQQDHVSRLNLPILGINRFAVVDPPPVPDVSTDTETGDCKRSKPGEEFHAHTIDELVRSAMKGHHFAGLQDVREPAGTTCQALSRQRLAAGFEVLRTRSRAYAHAHNGARPQIGVLALGPLRSHKQPVQQARDILESAGFQLLDPTPATGHAPEQAVARWRELGCRAAILCATPSDLAEHGDALLAGLNNGDRVPAAILCIGKQPDGVQPWHRQVTAFLAPGNNILAELTRLADLLCQPQQGAN